MHLRWQQFQPCHPMNCGNIFSTRDYKLNPAVVKYSLHFFQSPSRKVWVQMVTIPSPTVRDLQADHRNEHKRKLSFWLREHSLPRKQPEALLLIRLVATAHSECLFSSSFP